MAAQQRLLGGGGGVGYVGQAPSSEDAIRLAHVSHGQGAVCSGSLAVEVEALVFKSILSWIKKQ